MTVRIGEFDGPDPDRGPPFERRRGSTPYYGPVSPIPIYPYFMEHVKRFEIPLNVRSL